MGWVFAALAFYYGYCDGNDLLVIMSGVFALIQAIIEIASARK